MPRGSVRHLASSSSSANIDELFKRSAAICASRFPPTVPLPSTSSDTCSLARLNAACTARTATVEYDVEVEELSLSLATSARVSDPP